jgi:hypothetical protein
MLLLACGARPDAGATDSVAAGTADSVTPHDSAGAAEPPPATWTADEVALVADTLLLGAFPDAATVFAAWRDEFVDLTPPCPYLTGPYSISSSFSGCTAPDGRVWAGVAIYTKGKGGLVDLHLEADAAVTLEGREFVLAGLADVVLQEGGSFTTSIAGTWGPTGRTDWTVERPSVAVWAEGDATHATLYGGVSTDEGAIYLPDATWDAESCPMGTGAVQVRDPGGWWYTLVLDPSCTGCGTLDYAGTPMGGACVRLGEAMGSMVARTEAATW